MYGASAIIILTLNPKIIKEVRISLILHLHSSTKILVCRNISHQGFFGQLFVGTLHWVNTPVACDLHPLTPHFYIVKMGCTGVYMFSYFCSKI